MVCDHLLQLDPFDVRLTSDAARSLQALGAAIQGSGALGDSGSPRFFGLGSFIPRNDRDEPGRVAAPFLVNLEEMLHPI